MSGAAVPIDLWLWALDCDAAEVLRRSAVLSGAARARAERFVRDRDRVHYICGRWRLRCILGDLAGTPAAALPLDVDGNGKPFLPGGPVFNLSHAAGLVYLFRKHHYAFTRSALVRRFPRPPASNG